MKAAIYRFKSRSVAHLVKVSWSIGVPSAVTGCHKALTLDNLLRVIDGEVECAACVKRATRSRDGAQRVQDTVLNALPQRQVRWLHWSGTWKEGLEYGVRDVFSAWAYVRPKGSPKTQRIEAARVDA